MNGNERIFFWLYTDITTNIKEIKKRYKKYLLKLQYLKKNKKSEL